ncbi:hypothetical protein GGP41_004481 [Bipolaris sorokiniana]|uniref:IBR domain-containing protein n=1 Tax=Cochliobolus sativus TaxID=45130 RepID=A0A8H5Z6I4_COCSA|nr:hypothetical protein GGP41_004481 [Bipolaris sorokiniana]
MLKISDSLIIWPAGFQGRVASWLLNLIFTTDQPNCSSYLDGCITAPRLQIEEITYHNETSNKGKYPADTVPDHNVACVSYLSEIKSHLQVLENTKLAHSIANAVYIDAEIVTQMSQQETTEITCRLAAILTADDSLYTDTASEADPSVSSAQCQARALSHLSREQSKCCVCRGDFLLASVERFECGYAYCSDCFKRVVMRATVERDLVYMPPSLNRWNREKDTREKTYCANSNCGRLIAPAHIISSEATCPRYMHKTCSTCKNHYHEDDCPADLDLREALELGQVKRWQRCFSCRALVEIDWACNHMTVATDVLFGKSKTYITVQYKLWPEQRADTFLGICVNNVLTTYKTNFAIMTNAIIVDGRSSR